MGDITDLASLHAGMSGDVDAVFHVAADTSLWAPRNAMQDAVNIAGTRRVVQAALAKRARRLIHTSTCSAFGRHATPLTEETASNAMHSSVNYERSKWLAEEEVRNGIKAGLDAVIVNPCAVLGPGDTAGWAQLFFQIRDGKLTAIAPGVATFNHVREVVRAHLAAFARGRSGENYLLSGEQASFQVLVDLMAREMGVTLSAPVVPAGLLGFLGRCGSFWGAITCKEPLLTREKAQLLCASVRCDTRKAEIELGYQRTPLQECVRDSHEWLVEHGRLMRKASAALHSGRDKERGE